MTQHPTKEELDGYRNRELAPAVFLEVHQHVTACPDCSAQCNSLEDLSRDLEDLNTALLHAPDNDSPYHLSADEFRAYAQGTLDEIDLEIAESHLGICSACLGEVQQHQVVPGNVGPSALRPRALWSRWQPWRVAAVVSAGILLILLTLTLMLLRSRPATDKQRAGEPGNRSSPQSSPAQVAQGPSEVPTAQPSPELVMFLNDGNQKVTLDKQGTLAGLEQLPSPLKQRIQAALQTGRLRHASGLAQVKSQPGTQRGEPGSGLPFRLIGPLSQMAHCEPTFRWSALAGAQSYTVTVTDADLNEILTSPPLSTTEWQSPKKLPAHGIYSWQVTAVKDGVRITSPVMPAPQARFKVVDRATSDMLDQVQLVYPNSHLTLGVLYAEAGLLDEAEQELQALVRDNPEADITLKLLQQVNAMRAAQTLSSSRR